ncbi:MAG: DUF4294 domain-containing protein [Marinilabiliales bacterium]|nr:MAG: DUF4294 domain-containing protein [Marinilabiliales bacterium]
MRKIISITIILFACCHFMNGQELHDDTTIIREFQILKQTVWRGDTILHSSIEEVSIYPVPQFSSRREYRRYQRLIHNLKIVYPYALLAAEKLDEMNHAFLELKTERDRRAFVKQVEQELMNEFEDELKKLTITQGRLLIKLIDRETGNTSYELVRELRGSFSAFFWQAVARLFGSNLKNTFDAEGEDKLIDQILVLIDNGQI